MPVTLADRFRMRICLFLAALWLAAEAGADIPPHISLPDGTEIPVARSVPETAARARLLWLPSEYGLSSAELSAAQALAGAGFEVWSADLHTAYFLPAGRSALEDVPESDLAALIKVAAEGDLPLLLVASGRGAALALAAARHYQLAEPAHRLGGAILLYPNLYQGAPEPGVAPRYRPVAEATNLPLYLFQPLFSARRWHATALVEQLSRGGSSVYLHLLPEVGDDLFVRDDVTGPESALIERFPGLVARAAELLAKDERPRPAVAELRTGVDPAVPPPAAGLQPFPGNPVPPPLDLGDLGGDRHTLGDFRGKVVLVNFWATWCPPCVHEIPSLNRLYRRFASEGFTVLGVDVGDRPEQVSAFLEARPVEFPVLLDVDGASVDAWRVTAFPTNFLLDRNGRIRYAYFGALEWDSAPVVETVGRLIQEPAAP